MSTDPDTILLEAEDHMKKGLEYLQQELRGIRTGRASTALVDFVKVDVYGSPSDLKNIAAVSVPEPHQIWIKPYDPGTLNAIKQGIENAGLGLNPQIEDKTIRITIPPLDADRRKQLVAQAKKMGEEQKVVMRNARRDANKHAEGLAKQEGTHYPEDEISTLKNEIQELLKGYETQVDDAIKSKSESIMEV